MTTTPITQVPAACAAVWAPYGVTKVPPANLTDSTPVPPTVVNETNGAVSDADAKAWVVAMNRTAVWYRWSEANGQRALLPALIRISLIPSLEQNALADGASIDQPDCSSFGTAYDVFSLDTQGKHYFAGRGEEVNDSYVISVRYPGPCQIVAHYPDGRTDTLFSYPTAGRTVFAGSERSTGVLGDLWYSDAAADCTTQSPPAAWCPV